jgi:hypothetical protein
VALVVLGGAGVVVRIADALVEAFEPQAATRQPDAAMIAAAGVTGSRRTREG